MPEEQIVEQTAAPQPDEQTQPEAQEEELAEESKEEQEKKEEERKRKRTVTLLTALLLICLIAEVSLASYIGLTLYQNIQNQRILTAQYEAYVAWQEDQRQNPQKVQYIGPTVRVVDGELVDNYAAENAARSQAQNEIPGI